MKITYSYKLIILFTALFFHIKIVNAQNLGNSFCGADEALKSHFEQNPQAKKQFELNQLILKQNLGSYKTGLRSTIDTIPIVFHVLYSDNYPNSYTPDSIIQKALIGLNKDFAREGADTGSIAAPFKNLYVNSNIIFMLAKKDPSGNCTSGIVYYDTSKFFWNTNYAISNPDYWPTWDPTKYLNIIVPVNVDGIGPAYAPYPGGYPIGDARDAVVISSYLLNYNRILSHEVGHWLNLMHVFGYGYGCGDDNILDTPPCFIPNSYNCPSSLGGNICNGNGTENIENIMHYYSCAKNFTQGQTDVMQAALASTVGSRNNLSTPANLLSTGVISSVTCAPKAGFASSKNIFCQNTTISFYDFSYNGTPTSWQWTFSGGTPATSTLQNPVVTYNSIGVYSVSLKVANAQGADSITKTAFIKVNALTPILNNLQESFESTVTIPNSDWLNQSPGSNTWQLSSAAAASGINCVQIYNLPYITDYGIAFLTSTFRINTDSSSYLTFKHAYAQISSTSYEQFFVSVSNDCGETFIPVFHKAGAELSSIGASYATNTFVPDLTQWTTDTVYNINQFGNEVMLRFEFWAENDIFKGSDIYLDDINLNQTLSVNIQEQEKNNEEIVIYPNPTENKITISATNPIKQITLISVFGQLIMEKININDNILIIDLSMLPQGIYFFQLRTANGTVVKKIIKEK